MHERCWNPRSEGHALGLIGTACQNLKESLNRRASFLRKTLESLKVTHWIADSADFPMFGPTRQSKSSWVTLPMTTVQRGVPRTQFLQHCSARATRGTKAFCGRDSSLVSRGLQGSGLRGQRLRLHIFSHKCESGDENPVIRWDRRSVTMLVESSEGGTGSDKDSEGRVEFGLEATDDQR